jgi:hypothetical protein
MGYRIIRIIKMKNISTFENFLNEGRVVITKDQLKNVNDFLKSIGVKQTVKDSQYIDSQGGLTAIFQEWKKDKELENFAIAYSSIFTNAHISIVRQEISLMIDYIVKTHDGDIMKSYFYWNSVDNGKTFTAKRK